jgi:hypothetical protein
MKTLLAALKDSLTQRLLRAGTRLPYEIESDFPSERTSRMTAVLLGALALLELATFLWKGAFAVVMSRTWVLHGFFSVLYLLWVFCDVVVRDVRRLRFWFLLPIGLAVPLCFWNIRGFGALNTESLSELQHGLERLREPGWGYMEVFWQTYPGIVLWIYDQQNRRPGILFVRPGSPLVKESPPGYTVRMLRFGGSEDPSITPEIVGLVYLPSQIAAGH